MKAATYNPDTLKRIRRGARACDLGWDEAFYSSVCRRHGIEPIASPKTHVTPEIAATALATAPPAPASSRHKTRLMSGYTVGVTADTLCAVRDAASEQGVSISTFVRTAMFAAVKLGNLLPVEPRPTRPQTSYVSPTLSDEQVERFKAASTSMKLTLPKFIRRAVAHALNLHGEAAK